GPWLWMPIATPYSSTNLSRLSNASGSGSAERLVRPIALANSKRVLLASWSFVNRLTPKLRIVTPLSVALFLYSAALDGSGGVCAENDSQKPRPSCLVMARASESLNERKE